MRIQHNIMAMNAYRNYSNNTSALAKNLEKLSSGYRINRAGDDAAGLAISEKMRAQITALGTAQKNVKDGISLVKTAEGATQEVHDMLNRMVDLATQSANGTYQDEVDREAIEQEFNALKTEINRIADASNFNGIKLLDGSLSAAGKAAKLEDVTLTKVHDNTGDAVAAKQGEYVLDMGEWNASATADFAQNATVMTISLAGKDIALIASAKISAGDTIAIGDLKLDGLTDITIGGLTLGFKIDGTTLQIKGTKDPTQQQVEDFNKESLKATFTMKDGVINDKQIDHAFHAKEILTAKRDPQFATAQFQLSDSDIKNGASLKIGNDTFTFKVGGSTDDTGNGTEIVLKGFEDGQAGIAAEAARLLSQRNTTTDGKFHITTDNKGLVSITQSGTWTADDYKAMDVRGDLNKDNEAPWTMADGTGIVRLGTGPVAGKALTLQIGEDSESYNQLKVEIADMHVAALGLDDETLSTQEDAQSAVAAIKNAINSVSDTRGKLGATQNRLEHTANNLSTMKENIQDAEATIRDTDIAEEMMAYTKNNILVQSAQAMLAQANQIPQGVLQLLG